MAFPVRPFRCDCFSASHFGAGHFSTNFLVDYHWIHSKFRIEVIFEPIYTLPQWPAPFSHWRLEKVRSAHHTIHIHILHADSVRRRRNVMYRYPSQTIPDDVIWRRLSNRGHDYKVVKLFYRTWRRGICIFRRMPEACCSLVFELTDDADDETERNGTGRGKIRLVHINPST